MTPCSCGQPMDNDSAQSKDFAECPLLVERESVLDASLSDDVIEALDKRNASAERLAVLAELDAILLQMADSSSTEILPAAAWSAAIRFIRQLGDIVGLSHECMFSAILFLDLQCKSGSVNSLPSTCTAIISLVAKASGSMGQLEMADLARQASQFAEWLRSMGHEDVEVDIMQEQVLAKEIELLQASTWRLQLPTVHSWASIIFMRFNVLTDLAFVSSVEWVWRQGLLYARMVVEMRRPSLEIRPRRLANGVLCLGLIAARLLPLEEICPEDISLGDFEAMCTQCYPQNTVLSCLLPDTHTALMLEVLQAAAGCSLSELRSDVGAVGLVLQDALGGLAA